MSSVLQSSDQSVYDMGVEFSCPNYSALFNYNISSGSGNVVSQYFC
jgi:hypothetical protein